jgi:hypothetical protein
LLALSTVEVKMNCLRCVLLLQFATASALGQSASPGLPNQPAALVRSFYAQVVVRHPHDIPQGADAKIFAPYLSKSLLHKIDLAKACSDDWDRQNQEPHLKAEMATKYRPFSGDEWSGEPRAFKIERTQSEKDGSSRVFVNLTSTGRYAGSWNSRVAVVVLREESRYVIDDVIYINDATYDNPEDKPPDPKLSDYLAAGCNGPRWIGPSLPGQPVALIRSLYEQVLAHMPGGIPVGADWKIFAPYMSKTLLRRIDDFDACSAEWFGLHHDPKHPVKAPFGVYESGIFSGGDERTGPRSFDIERTQAEKDGSVRVYVKLAWWDAPVHKKPNDPREYTSADKPYIWHVAPILVRENGRLVIDDVIYLKDETDPVTTDYRLSQVLSEGCNGSHWAGYR